MFGEQKYFIPIPNKNFYIGLTIASTLSTFCLRLCSYWNDVISWRIYFQIWLHLIVFLLFTQKHNFLLVRFEFHRKYLVMQAHPCHIHRRTQLRPRRTGTRYVRYDIWFLYPNNKNFYEIRHLEIFHPKVAPFLLWSPHFCSTWHALRKTLFLSGTTRSPCMIWEVSALSTLCKYWWFLKLWKNFWYVDKFWDSISHI